MNYINQYKLIQHLVRRIKPDAREFLAEVDRQAVAKALKRTKEGLPKPISCTKEPVEEKNFARLPPKVKRKLNKIHSTLTDSPKGSARVMPELLQLRKQHPNVPTIANYIGLVYANSGQYQKYFDHTVDTVRRFPEYLFGKAALAELYLRTGCYKEVPKVYEGKLQIYMHYPPTAKVFHCSEVRAFYATVGAYHAKSNQTTRALYCYFVLESADAGHWAVTQLANEIMLNEIQKLQKKICRY